MNNKWNIFIGTAAEDKFYNSNLLKIFVTEFSPLFKGNLSDQTTKEKIKIKEIKSKKNTIIDKNIEVKTSNIVLAEYFGIFTNRFFSPDIRKGEQVLLIKYIDIDRYYWLSLGRDDDLRQLEKYRISISDSKSKVKKLNEDNTYYIELDTLHKKSIIIRTSKGDNERFRYIIHIDAKNNKISIEDDDDNYIHLDSNIPRIINHNKNGCFVDINKDDVFINAERDIRISAKRLIYLQGEILVEDIKTVKQTNAENIDNNSNMFSIQSDVGITGSTKINGNIASNTSESGDYNETSPDTSYTSPEVDTDINQVSVKTN